MSLVIENLHASVGDVPVLNGLSLCIPPGEVHAIMGPNGAGKSTLTAVLCGHENYVITEGSITYNGLLWNDLPPEQRAAAGLFTAVQYPPEIPGVAGMVFMRTTLNALRRKRGDDEITAPDFLRAVKRAAAQVGLPEEMLKRAFNDGFSGGEKKRCEIIQMLLAEPSLCVLDEIDSGLDVDALRSVAEAVAGMRTPQRSMLVITHYRRLLDYLPPDRVHVLARGRIACSGGFELIEQIEASGYEGVLAQAA